MVFQVVQRSPCILAGHLVLPIGRRRSVGFCRHRTVFAIMLRYRHFRFSRRCFGRYVSLQDAGRPICRFFLRAWVIRRVGARFRRIRGGRRLRRWQCGGAIHIRRYGLRVDLQASSAVDIPFPMFPRARKAVEVFLMVIQLHLNGSYSPYSPEMGKASCRGVSPCNLYPVVMGSYKTYTRAAHEIYLLTH